MRSDGPVFVLVHSPLVGPSTWQPVARELERDDRVALVPSLAGVAHAPAPQWRHVCRVVKASTADITRPVILVGHSGAGLLLPTIADAVSCPVAAMLFVDSFLPPPTGTAALVRPEFLDELRGRAQAGVLPPWSRWFGEDAMRELVADDAMRGQLEADMPRLPLSYFEGEPPVTEGWDQRPCAYLLLSDPYSAAAADAKARGWPVIAVPNANHLSLATDPKTVTGALLDLEQATRARTSSKR